MVQALSKLNVFFNVFNANLDYSVHLAVILGLFPGDNIQSGRKKKPSLDLKENGYG